MTSQKIGIDLVFKANTQSAAANINQLSASLQQIVNKQFSPQISDANIRKAAQAAQDLSRHLDAAINTDTGKLDLVKFNNSLQSSGQNLNSLTSNLLKAGRDGEQAFVKLSKSISTAQTPMFQMQGILSKMWTSLKNVAKWQISSKLFMSLTSGISNAYKFAQDLNQSLNNIRIVTGKSAEEMDRFAKKANEAAKALNTTTTKYTDAALIFFQQGLSEKKAIERTNTTIKLANVTGQSVQEISNQLTAIWNNFDDGTKPLEYYADVITALGAATASSSKEISEGLEKFAAVGETVGLSYEYATAALATVTATTRQSADVVGTAFKTLFARIQDLELGNTLDDGTTLGQYSQALEAVGINIKDANGEVKDMNIILDEMGAKWGTLNKDAQIALAQNVAGVRQYTQLMALMENYDFFKENLKTAEESSGTLQEQADIYAESWKAARDEVTAALEDIYMDLLDDDFFVDFLKGLADIINSLDYFIEQIGGLGPLFIQIGSIFLSAFAHKVGPALSNLVTQFQLLRTAGTQKVVEKVTKPHIEQVDAQLNDPNAKYTEAERQSLNFDKDNIAMRAKLTLKSSKMSESEKQGYEAELARNQQLQDWIIKRIEKSSELTRKKEEELKILQEQVKAQEILVNTEQQRAEIEAKRINAQKIVTNEKGIEYDQKQLTKTIKERTAYEQKMAQEGWSEQQKQADEYYQRLLAEEQRYKQNIAAREKVRTQLTGHTRKKVTSEEALQVANSDTKQANSLQQQTAAAEKGMQAYKKLRMEQAETAMATNKTASETDKLIASLDKVDSGASDINTVKGATQFLQEKLSTLSANDLPSLKRALELLGQSQGIDMIDQDVDNLVNSSATAQQEIIELRQEIERLTAVAEQNKNSFNPKHTAGKMEAITSAAGGLASAASAVQSLGAAFRSLQDESVEPSQRIMNFMTSLVMVAPSAIFAIKGIMTAFASGHSTLVWVSLALTALIGIISWVAISWEKQQTAAEKAKDAYKAMSAGLEQLNEQLDKTKTKLEEVKTLFEDYIELENSFDKLIEGSDAYNENLQKQQELIRQLIKEYPQLVKYGLIDPNTNKIVDIDWATAVVEGTQTAAYIQAQAAQEMAEAKTAMAKQEAEFIEQRDKLNAEATDVFGWTQEDLYTGRTANYITYKGYGDIGGLTYTGVHSYLMTITNDLAKLLMDSTNKEDFMGSVTEYASTMSSDWLESKEDFIESVSVVFDQFCEQWEEIQLKNNDALKTLNATTVASLQSLAGTINSNIIGYANLSSIRQGAANKLLFDDLNALYQDFDYQIVKGKTEYGEGFRSTLEQILGEELADTWVYGKKTGNKGKGTEYADVSWNLEHTDAGKALVDAYLESRGVKRSEVEFSDWTSSSVKIDFGGETGEETVQLAAIMETAVSKFADAISDESLTGNIKTAGSLSNVIAAGLTGQVNYLTQEEVDSITQLGDGEKLELTDDYEQAYRTLREGIDPDQVEKELINFTESLNQYDASLAKTIRLQEEMQKGKALIATEAEKYDLDAEMLERYADTLKDTQDVSYETAAAIAISSAKISKGVDKLRDVLEDSIDTLKNYDVSSYEFAEAAAEVGEALELMFGAEVSNDKIKKWAESGDLQKLANGGQEALDTFEKLRLEVGQDYVASLHLDESIESELQGLLSKLDAAAKEFGQGHEFDLEADGALETLQKLLDDSKITVDQIKQMFGSIGWEPEIDYVDELSPPSRTMTGSVDAGSAKAAGDLLNNPQLELAGENLTWTVIETRSMIKKPVLRDSNGSGKAGATYTGGAGAGLSNIRTKKAGSGSKSKKQTKKTSDEAERYHEIKEKLSDLNREYDKLGELKDRAFGQSHLDYLDKEAEKLDTLIEAQKEYIAEIKENLEIDKSELAQYGASFDSAGRITNYDKMVAANVEAYNQDVNAFNSGRMSEEQFEKREEAYEKFMNDIAAYEETLNLLEDEELELFNKQNERFDKALEKAEYVVEYGTSLVEDSLSIIEYQLEKIEDKAYSTAEALALMGQKMNEVSKKSDIYKEGIETTLAASGLSIDNILGASSEELAELVANGTFTAEQVEQLRNYRDELLNTNQEMKDMANETLDKLLEGFDEWNEAIDKNKEKIDHLKEVTSSYRDIIDLIGKDNLGVSNQMLEQMNEFNITASQSQVDITRRQLEENKRSLEKAREEYRNAASEEEKYYWGQVVESLEETVMQGESDLLSATQDSLNTIQEAFKDTLTNITEEFEKAISGMYGSLEALQSAYDQRTDERERYLEDYAKIYELSKLTRDINKSMDESDSIRGKQRLLEIQEEINALQESGVEMTQFEVDELRARYDLRLAEIALEEAQNAKSQVRMTRDSEGNWSYTYTADQDAIDSAQQNYEDKLYAYQNLTTEYIYDLESQILAIPKELVAALQAIWEDTTLTPEQQKAREKEAIQFYTEQDAHLKEQLGKAIGRSKELYDQDWKNYSNATGYKISADEQWMDSFDETVLSQITGFKTLEEYQQAFAGSATKMANDMRTAYQAMTSNIDKTLQNMGTSMATFAQDLQGLMNTNKQKIEEYTKEVDDDIEKMGTSSAEAMKKAADNWALYADYVANSAGANENLATALNNVITAIGNVGAPLDDLSKKYEELERDAKAAAAAITKLNGIEPGGDDPLLPPPPEDLNNKVVEERSGKVFYANYTNLINNDLTASKPLVYDKSSDLSIGRMDAVSGIVGYEIKNGTKTLGWVTGIDLQEMKQKNSSLATSMAASKFTGGNMVIATDDLAVYGGPMTKGAEAFFKAGAQLTGNKKEINNSTYLEAKTVAGAKMGASSLIYLDPRYIKIGLMSQYDTGGYTGSWDSSGRLAMLHQKELVLNADDTKNFLAAVNIVRELSAAIDLKALAYQNALGQMSGAIRMSHEPQRLQQDVTIHAEFPNVTERNEIEAAFNSLMNQATQYVYRK